MARSVCVLVAEIVTLVEEVTDFVVTVKVALVFPAVTVTELGTVATVVELLVSPTTVPPAGAGPVSVTVAVEGVPPFTVVGFSVSEATPGTFTLRMAVFAAPLYLTVIVICALTATVDVVMVKFAMAEPAATVTVAGTCATAVLLLDTVITAPPAGAGPFKVMVPAEVRVPTTVVGFSVNVERAAAETVRVAARVTPYVPEIVAEALDATPEVVIVKVAVVAPPGTVTVAGT